MGVIGLRASLKWSVEELQPGVRLLALMFLGLLATCSDRPAM